MENNFTAVTGERTPGSIWGGRKDVHDSNGIVIEDGRDVFRGEFVGRVADEETCLADSTVTDDDTPAGGSRALARRNQQDGRPDAAPARTGGAERMATRARTGTDGEQLAMDASSRSSRWQWAIRLCVVAGCSPAGDAAPGEQREGCFGLDGQEEDGQGQPYLIVATTAIVASGVQQLRGRKLEEDGRCRMQRRRAKQQPGRRRRRRMGCGGEEGRGICLIVRGRRACDNA